MVNKRKEDIVFSNTVYLSEENHRKFPIYMRLLQAFVIFVGSYCFMTIFIKCFDLQIINSQLIIAIIISQAIFIALSLFPKFELIKIVIVLTIYGGILYNRYSQLKNGVFLLENAIIRRASDYYGFPAYSFVADRSWADRDITLLLIMIIIPVVGIITLSLIRGYGKIFCYIILLIPAIISFSMGVTPPEVDFIAYILVFVFLVISNGFSHDKSSLHKGHDNIHKSMIRRISIRAAAIFSLLVLLLFLIIKQFVPTEKYNNYNAVYETKTRIQTFMTDLSFEDVFNKLNEAKLRIRPSRIDGLGGLGLGDLGRVDQIRYDESEHLHIKAPLQSVIEGIYLKGYVGSEYTGDSWDTHSRRIRKNYNEMISNISQEDYEPAIGASVLLNQSPYRNDINQGKIEVRYDKANRKYIYAPYFTIFSEKNEVSFEYDLAATSDKRIEVGIYNYSYNLPNYIDDKLDLPFYDAGFLALSSHTAYSKLKIFHENESIYRKFVYETYTILPEEGLDRLKHEFSREEVGSASEDIRGAIEYVKDYLNQHMRYTLSPGRLPRNKDFVEYFLYENKVGYCSHFASAGALMLRAMGYPARYVEGYAISRSDLMNQTMTSYIDDENSAVDITVKDYNAHAWVEVYYDGFGWIPVEFTSGSEMEDMVDSIGDFDYERQALIDNEIIEPTDIPPSPTVLPDKDQEPSPLPEQEEETKGSGILKDDDDKSGKGPGWYLMASLLLILLAGIIIYLVVRLRRNIYVNENCYSKRAIRLYIAIERLFIISHGLPNKAKSLEEYEEYAKDHLTLVSIEDFEACMDTVRKARFSREAISHEEYMIVKRFYSELWNRIYERLPVLKKIYFRIIL